MAPTDAQPTGQCDPPYQKLEGKRILIVDTDKQVVQDAHSYLEKYGCIVESAHNGNEAVCMFRNCGSGTGYDVVISSIHLPDYSGYQLMLRLQKLVNPVPLALMQGFGHDPGHVIVKAREAGLPKKSLMSKPFKPVQILTVVESIIDSKNLS
jgi:CheY-like chemotaxis protein